MSGLLNIVYAGLLALASPWLLYRRLRLGKRFGNWRQKLLGELPAHDGRPTLWLHAVSVGEVLQLEPVVQRLLAERPDVRLVLTTTTTTGFDVARRKYPACDVCYFPLDFSWAVARALDRVRPEAVILVELELWPNFLMAAFRRRIPVAIINGRLSEKSFRGYVRLRPLWRRLLPNLAWCAVQTPAYAERFIALGANPARVHVTGSIKFDRVETRRDRPLVAELRHAFGLAPTARVFIAGSTQAPEEEHALDAYAALLPSHPDLRLLIVPRHKERFEEVARLIATRGWGVVRRSSAPSIGPPPVPLSPRGRGVRGEGAADQPPKPLAPEPHSPGVLPSSGFTHAPLSPAPLPRGARGFGCADSNLDRPPVLLLDTLGELPAAWGLAEIAFVGGSLMKRGGQNMIEPAGYGAAILFGPHTHNFKDVVENLLSVEGARVVPSAAELTPAVDHWLSNPADAAAHGRRAQEFVLSQQGATDRTFNLLRPLLPPADRVRAA